MRTIVDLPDDDVKALDMLAKRKDESRAELVRRAVANYLEQENKPHPMKNDIFGTMGDVFTEDALVIEQRLRGEWDEREGGNTHWSLNERGQPPYKGGKPQ